MANKQRGPLPPVMSTEETRVRPPEEEEEQAPEEEPSFDPQRDQTQLVSRKGMPAPALDWSADEDGTPIMPSLAAPQDYLEDATRPIARKTAARPALETPDDATRPIPRKTAARPALTEDPDTTGPIARKSPPSTRTPAIPWEPEPEDEMAYPTTAAQSSRPPALSPRPDRVRLPR